VTLTFSRITLAPLWTTAEVKALQLRITDAAHDADVAEKLAAAQELILAYLGPSADPTWTPATAPIGVKHMILLLTSTLYEVRGGEDQAENLRKAWDAIRLQLGPYRDPTLA
jgi:hypothetical protein